MSNDPFEVQVQHFAALKSKYQATKYEDSSPSSLLYLILRKADLEIEISKFERKWLQEHKLLETIKAIDQEPRRKAEERRKLEAKFSQLKSKFKAIQERTISSSLYPILWKLDSENYLTDLEVKYLQEQGLTQTVTIVQEMARFALLKAKYRATEYPNCSLDSPLYQILKQLDARQILSDVEANWLFNNQLIDTLEIFRQQKAEREADFALLKDKYKASEYPETSVSSPLYQILKKLKWELQLSESELNWLEEHQLSETLSIVLEIEQTRHFAELKVKYKANESEDSSRSSHLYKVLKKIDLDHPLGEQDINFLKKRKLTETITLALDKFAASLKSKIESGEQLSEADIDWLQKNGHEDIITLAEKTRFAALKSKYEVSDYKDKTPSSPLYAILQKLDKGERLEPTDVGWLEENKIEASQPSYSYYGWQEERRSQGQRLFSGKIFTAYHKIEALFYGQEYKNTGNKWNLPNASSHWRKADEPESALKVTENLDFDKIKENKLKSALLTTRGGAFRDIHKLDDAQKCALKAIEYQPQSHHPYTLMGAICFERSQFSEGERWFSEAIKRGASPRDQDAEMKRVVKNAKNGKRREVVEYLLKKDPQRYAWAKFYRNRQDG